MSANFTLLKGDLHTHDLIREAAERSFNIVASEGTEDSVEVPFGTGHVSISEVQPGLSSESILLNCHSDWNFDVSSDPLITCQLTLAGRVESVRIDDFGVVEYPLKRATLIGLGEPSKWLRRVRTGQFFKTFGFTIKPVFFDRYASFMEDEQLAVFEPFRKGRCAVPLPSSYILTKLGENALRHPYNGALDRIYHESNALQFVLEIAKLLRDEDLMVESIGRKHYDRLMHAQAILDGDLIDPPKTLDLAQQVGTNINTLQTHFKIAFGTTIFGYIRTQRLEMARVLITEHKLGAAQAGYRVGFSNPAAFTAAYRKYFSYPPSAEK